jgi:hypothetical protein
MLSVVNVWVTNERIHGNASLGAFQVRDVKLGSKGRGKGGQLKVPKVLVPTRMNGTNPVVSELTR